MSATHCSFAPPGTYGHECGAPATQVGLRKSTETRNGIFYARRCDACASIKGGENAGISQWQKFDASAHVNQWGSAMSVRDTLQAFDEAAVRCRSNLNGGACVCDPKCFDVCYVEAEQNEIDECALAQDRAAREGS